MTESRQHGPEGQSCVPAVHPPELGREHPREYCGVQRGDAGGEGVQLRKAPLFSRPG